MKSLMGDTKMVFGKARVHSVEYKLTHLMGEDSRSYLRLTLATNGYFQIGDAVNEVVNL